VTAEINPSQFMVLAKLSCFYRLLSLQDYEFDNRGSVPIKDFLVVSITKTPLWLIQPNVTEGFTKIVKRPKREANESQVQNKQY
jgi:hypothetical protein